MTTHINYTCLWECGDGPNKIGLFHIRHPSQPIEDGWIIARIPRRWGTARSSKLIPPDADGQVELPRSVLPEFRTQEEALKYFRLPSIEIASQPNLDDVLTSAELGNTVPLSP